MTTLIEKFIQDAPAQIAGTGWLKDARSAGVARFNEVGIPTTKDEDWKYTNLRALASKQFDLAEPNVPVALPDAMSGLLAENDAVHRMVFIGGVFNDALSDDLGHDLDEGITIKPMQLALEENTESLQQAMLQVMPEQANAFAALNTGLFRDGVYIHLDEHCVLTKPLELIFINSGELTLSMPRNLIVLADGARAKVIERQVSNDDCTALSNSATEIILGENSYLDYNLIQQQGKKATHIGGTWVSQAAGSQFFTRTITLGGQMVRNELKVSLNGEGAHADCLGLYYGRQRQHIDNHTTIRHAAPNCTSREIYKGILDDRARGVFHGRVLVEQDAQLTAAEQQNKNLLLSRDAEVDTKPQLEIYADDVKCSHGATVGELDKKQLFYLQTRGIGLQEAKELLTFAFAAEILEEIELESLREDLKAQVAQQMNLNLGYES
ncbi:MAG: Fe-S cluster assembly protein SufD [Arenicellales bacterium]